MLQARWIEHVLEPRFELGTSKGAIHARTVWYLIAWQHDRPKIRGIGEAALFPGHSKEFPAEVRTKLVELCADTSDWARRLTTDLADVPSVRFAVEQCLRDLEVSGTKQLFLTPFTLGEKTIPINGLVWMGNKATMKARIREQIDNGFTTIKMKIGAIDIDDELELLRSVRAEFSPGDITLRVDANGAFNAQNVMGLLERLAELSIHSIEQPVAPGLYEIMAELCERSPVPIGLDEDLIGLNNRDPKVDLLNNIKPQYIVIKPSLVGGWVATKEWIDLATARGIKWWITSALESSIGLNAIAQFTATLNVDMPQGLGTGSVYANNISAPLLAEKGTLRYRPETPWDLSLFRLNMSATLDTLTIDGRTFSGDALVDRAIALRHAQGDAEWVLAFHSLVDEIITSDGPLIARTSGTTGPPKRIELARKDLLASAHLTGRTFDLHPGDRVLLCLPCDLIAGKMMVIRAMALGLDLHLKDPRGSVLDGLPKEEHFRFAAMVPHQLQRALNEDRSRVEAEFDTVLLGGGPLGKGFEQELIDMRTAVIQGYGSTETLTHVALRALNGPDRSDMFKAIGEVGFGLDIRGCLVVYTPHLSTPQHITNDLVELIDGTHFRWLGRIDNVILSGGKKVFPEQLESRTSQVIPYPHYFTASSDDLLGQAIVLVVETERPSEAVVPELMSALMGVLDKHELPAVYERFRVLTGPGVGR